MVLSICITGYQTHIDYIMIKIKFSAHGKIWPKMLNTLQLLHYGNCLL